MSVLTFLNVTLALLLPTLLVAARATPTPAVQAEEQSERQLQQQQRRWDGMGGAVSWAARHLAAAWAAVDAVLAALCSGQGLDWPHQLLLAHGLLSLIWLLSISVGCSATV